MFHKCYKKIIHLYLPREAHVQTTQTIRGYRSVIDSLSSKLNTIQVTNSPPEQVEAFVANVSCGQCNLELDRDECDLAIRREEATYFRRRLQHGRSGRPSR